MVIPIKKRKVQSTQILIEFYSLLSPLTRDPTRDPNSGLGVDLTSSTIRRYDGEKILVPHTEGIFKKERNYS